MSRIPAAFSSFFSLLFSNELPAAVAAEYGYEKPKPAPPPPAPEPKMQAADGAKLLLGILQRDARLVDFLMEDIQGYSDEQVGAAVRTLHTDGRSSLQRHFTFAPVIDGVEGTAQKLDSSRAPDPARIKLIGNVPANGKAPGGILRHRGWLVSSANLPAVGKLGNTIVAPAEIEVE